VIPADPDDPNAMYNTNEGSLNNQGDPDIQSALSAVQKVLAYTRAQHGLPAQLLGDQGNSLPQGQPDQGIPAGTPPSGALPSNNDPSEMAPPSGVLGPGSDAGQTQQVADQPVQVPAGLPKSILQQQTPTGPQKPPAWMKLLSSNDQSGDGATQSFDEGGAVEESGAIPDQAQEGGQQPNLQGYVQGAGAVQPEVAMAMEQQTDPQGQMDPAARKLLTIAKAGDPQTQMGLLQHYKQRFQALNTFARVAAQGSQQRPADLAASTQAATRAYHNVPTGKSLSFQPGQNGVTVKVNDLAGAGGSAPQQSQNSFAAGGAVPDDTDAPNPPADDAPADPGTDTGTGTGTGTYNLSLPQYLNFLGSTGQYDSLVDRGPDQAVKMAAQAAPEPKAPGFTIGEAGEPGDKPFRRAVPEGTDPGDEQAAALMFPSVGQNQKRLQFLTAQAQQRAELENKTDVAKQQGVNQTNAINLRNTGQNYRAGLSNDTKRDIATMNAGQRDNANQMNNFRANLNEIILNNPNIDPNEAVKRAAIGMNGARSNFQPNQPQAPQQGGRQPTQNKPQAPVSIPPSALSRLKEGTNTRFSNGQTWTLQNGQPVQVQ
jgi:hypothetical protein